MNTFKRATISIKRQPVKSFSLLLIITLLGGFLLSGISMSKAIVIAQEHLLMQIPAVATLSYRGNLHSGWRQPTKDQINAIGNLPYVRSYDFTLRTFFYSQELSWINSMDPGHFTAMGVNNKAITEIESGSISLTEGRTFAQEEINDNALVMVIPKSIAMVNNLVVGSSIEIANIAHDYRWHGDWSDRFNDDFILSMQMLEFEVIGIFGSLDDDENYFNGLTVFYIPFGVAESMLDFENRAMIEADEEVFVAMGQGILQEEAILETLFVLDNPRDLESFTNASLPLLPEDWILTGLDESIFQPIINSMDLVLELATSIQLGAIIAFILILTITLLLFLRDRRHEIGIYMALGDKKLIIMLQILTEVFAIAKVGIVLAIFIGTAASALVSNYLFENHLVEQLTAVPIEIGGIPWELFHHVPNQMTIDEALSLLDVSLDMGTVLTFAFTGIVVVMASTIIPTWYVMKLKPTELLS